MRWLLAVLVLANVFAFALFQGWLAPWIRGDREPQRVLEQRHADGLQVVPLERLGAGRAAVPVRPLPPAPVRGAPAIAAPVAPPVSSTLSSPGSSSPGSSSSGLSPSGLSPSGPSPSSPSPSSPAAPGALAAANGPATVCVAFAPLDEPRANRVREALESAGARVESVRIEQAANYLVYAPPAATPAETNQRMAALRRAGQSDAFVMQDGPQRLGISVGLFRSEDMARALVARLEEQGETGLRVAPRGAVTARTRLQAHWPAAVAAGAVAAMAGRFDLQPRDCS